MFTKYLTFAFLACILLVVQANPPNLSPDVPPIRKEPSTPTFPSTGRTCPAPSAETLRCMRQWACQYLIRLDLRCLLNLNGNPLLGGLLGGGNGGGLLGGNGGLLGGDGGGGLLGGGGNGEGGGGGGVGGILGGILG